MPTAKTKKSKAQKAKKARAKAAVTLTPTSREKRRKAQQTRVTGDNIQDVVAARKPKISQTTLDEGIVQSSGCKIIRKSEVPFTQALATEFLHLPEFRGERSVSDNWVDQLLRRMKRGEFQTELVRLAKCHFDGKEYRINGHHTCWARLDMPKDYRPKVQLVTYRAETEDDMRKLYATYDQSRTRTASQVTHVRLFGTPEFDGISKTALSKLSGGMAFWLWDKSTTRNANKSADRANLLQNVHLGLALSVAEVMGNTRTAENIHVWRDAVFAAAFATLDKGAKKNAKEFWEGVINGVGMGAGDPRLKLRDFLVTTAVSTNSPIHKNRKVNSEEMYRACISMWNKWRKGETVRVVKIPKVRQAARR